jgi:hypothetical protein
VVTTLLLHQHLEGGEGGIVTRLTFVELVAPEPNATLGDFGIDTLAEVLGSVSCQ